MITKNFNRLWARSFMDATNNVGYNPERTNGRLTFRLIDNQLGRPRYDLHNDPLEALSFMPVPVNGPIYYSDGTSGQYPFSGGVMFGSSNDAVIPDDYGCHSPIPGDVLYQFSNTAERCVKITYGSMEGRMYRDYTIQAANVSNQTLTIREVALFLCACPDSTLRLCVSRDVISPIEVGPNHGLIFKYRIIM